MPVLGNGGKVVKYYKNLYKYDRQHFIEKCEFKDNEASGIHARLGSCLYITNSTITDNKEVFRLNHQCAS